MQAIVVVVELYLLRHGIAEEASAHRADAQRALTAEGRKRLMGILRSAAAAGVKPALVLTSPHRRAVETAEVAAEALGYRGELLRTKSLLPGATPQDVWEEVRAHRGVESLLLSGHEPLLSTSAAFLLGAPNVVIEFKKGSMARIDVERFPAEPHGTLRWLLAPKMAAKG
jgi:phosphohistidine phosphatase